MIVTFDNFSLAFYKAIYEFATNMPTPSMVVRTDM